MNRLVALVRRAVGLITPSPARRARRRRETSRFWMPSVRPQAPDVLRNLRAIGPDLDYYVEQNGMVLLLEHQELKERIAVGRRRLERGHNDVDAHLMAAGFAVLAFLPPHAIDSGEIYRKARRILSITPEEAEAMHTEAALVADGTRHQEHVHAHQLDRLHAEYRSDHAILFRHRKSFGTPRQVFQGS